MYKCLPHAENYVRSEFYLHLFSRLYPVDGEGWRGRALPPGMWSWLLPPSLELCGLCEVSVSVPHSALLNLSER